MEMLKKNVHSSDAYAITEKTNIFFIIDTYRFIRNNLTFSVSPFLFFSDSFSPLCSF